MNKTVGYYKTSINRFKERQNSISASIIRHYPDRLFYVRVIFKRKFEKLDLILCKRRLKKFQGDKLDIDGAKNFVSKMIKNFGSFQILKDEHNEKRSDNGNVNESHYPILLVDDASNISKDLKTLCAFL